MFSKFREVSRTNSCSISESTLRVISFLTLRPDNNSDDELEMEKLFYREYLEFFFIFLLLCPLSTVLWNYKLETGRYLGFLGYNLYDKK